MPGTYIVVSYVGEVLSQFSESDREALHEAAAFVIAHWVVPHTAKKRQRSDDGQEQRRRRHAGGLVAGERVVWAGEQAAAGSVGVDETWSSDLWVESSNSSLQGLAQDQKAYSALLPALIYIHLYSPKRGGGFTGKNICFILVM